jgi:hypothetical protein
LIDIPTLGSRSSLERRRAVVKKWDKETVRVGKWFVFPKYALGYVSFSKTGMPFKYLKVKQMGRISTFQATTTTATSICSF